MISNIILPDVTPHSIWMIAHTPAVMTNLKEAYSLNRSACLQDTSEDAAGLEM